MTEMDQKTEPAVGAPALTALAGNPLLEDWTGSGVPPFSRISAEHFPPAYARAFAEHETQIAAIASDPAPPTLANTIDLLERSGQSLERIDNLFHLLAGATADDALLAVEREMAPRLARHWNKVRTNATLLRRIDAVRQAADRLGLDAEQKRVVERYHTNYRRPSLRWRSRQGSGLPKSWSAWRCSALRSAITCWPTSRPSHCRSKAKPNLPACPTSLASLCAPRRSSAGLTAMLSPSPAPSSSRFCNFPNAGICVKRCLGALSCAATTVARPTIKPSSPRWCGCARSGQSCSATPTSRNTGSTMQWRKRPPRSAPCLVPSGCRLG